jgi:peptidoglycan/LPS O-acetylase OafA/YrhL
LMFFLSGLFVWHSLQRKGSGGFLRHRALRLGLPFVLAAAFVAPLAYFPTYLATGAAPSLSGFWQQWSSLGQWPAGPAWFLWVLLTFDALAAALFLLLPKWGDTLGRFASNAARRPAAFFWLLAAVSAVAYVPMAVAFSSVAWSSFGPFVFQTSRLIHYAVYFLAGAGVGAWGLEKGLLAPDGKLARRWPAWLFASLGAFILALIILISALSSPGKPKLWELIGGFTFVLSCAASTFAFLALFVRFAKTRSRIFDSLRSLRENAYGIFLVHYAFVSWLQYALLKTPLPGLAKGSCVFLGALALSWGVTAALRRIPGVARVI